MTRIRMCIGGLLTAMLMETVTVALAEQPRPVKPRTQVSAPRPSTHKPAPQVSATPDSAQRARIEAACVRYRVMWGMDCPSENGSGTGGVDPLRDVRRLGVQNPAKK